MNTYIQQTVLDEYGSPVDNRVSDRCWFEDSADVRCVYVGGLAAYQYTLGDRVGERQVWVQVHCCGFATQKEIAAALGRGERTVRYWVRRYREQGAAGLLHKAGAGRPRQITPELKEYIYRLRTEARASLSEIAQKVGLCKTSVHNALQKMHDHEDQMLLEFTDTEPEIQTSDGDDEQHEQCRETAVVEEPEEDLNREYHSLVEQEKNEDAEEKPKASMDVDPLDRCVDRSMAAAGLLDDAAPLFAETPLAAYAGVFMAMCVVAGHPVLGVTKRLYGGFGAAFYGLRTTVVTMVMLALLRIKRPEHVRKHNATDLGRVLGLDRIAEVKTIRRRLGELGKRGKAVEVMREIARERARQYEGKHTVVLVDGHVEAYSGGYKVAQVYSARKSRVVKGHTGYWAHLPDGTPLMDVVVEVNDSLVEKLPEIAEEAGDILGDKPICVFDRGGYSAELFERLLNKGYGIITYRREPVPHVPVELFEKTPTTINTRTYEYAPYEQSVDLPVYEIRTDNQGKELRVKTKRVVKMRDIRVMRNDGGQTPVLVALPEERTEKLSTFDALSYLFSRTGMQENWFKYMIAQFDLDALAQYGAEDLTEDQDRPNPDYLALKREIAKHKSKLTKALAAYGTYCASGEDSEKPRRKTRKSAQLLGNIQKHKDAIAKQREELATIAERRSMKSADFKTLPKQTKLLMNVFKMTAYQVETELYDLLKPHYSRSEDEGRSFIASALHTRGSIRLEPGRLKVQLQPQSSAARTRAINALTATLNERKVKFPGSDRVIYFEPTPVT